MPDRTADEWLSDFEERCRIEATHAWKYTCFRPHATRCVICGALKSDPNLKPCLRSADPDEFFRQTSRQESLDNLAEAVSDWIRRGEPMTIKITIHPSDYAGPVATLQTGDAENT